MEGNLYILKKKLEMYQVKLNFNFYGSKNGRSNKKVVTVTVSRGNSAERGGCDLGRLVIPVARVPPLSILAS